MRLDAGHLAEIRKYAESILAGVQHLEEIGDLDPTWQQDPSRADGYLTDLIDELDAVDSSLDGSVEDLGSEMIL